MVAATATGLVTVIYYSTENIAVLAVQVTQFAIVRQEKRLYRSVRKVFGVIRSLVACEVRGVALALGLTLLLVLCQRLQVLQFIGNLCEQN